MIALAVSLAALLAAQPGGRRPSNAVLRRAYQAARSSTVQVIGPKASGTGIIVGAAGEVLTSPQYVGLNDAKVLWDGGQVPAHVALADARLKVALVEISAPGTFPSVAVKLQDSLEVGSWVIGVVQPLGKHPSVVFGKVTRPSGGEAIFAEAELSLPPGTPVFDGQSRLIGLAVERSGKHATRILPLSTIKAQLTAFLNP